MRRAVILEHIGFILLAVLAYLFRYERVFADSGYYLIRVINSKWFWVEHNRLILTLPEIAPLIGVWLNLGIAKLVTIYSIGHVAFHYIIYLICRFHFQNLRAGITILLIQVLGISSGFFVPMFELYYAASLLVLVDSILRFKAGKSTDPILMFILTLFIASAHFYAVILLALIFILHTTETKELNWKNAIVAALTVGVVLVYKRFHISEYEQGKINAFIDGWSHFDLSSEYIKGLSSFLFDHYPQFLILLAISFVGMVVQRKYYTSVLFLSSFIGLMIMITVSYSEFSPSRYQEQVYFPITFLVAFQFVAVLFQIQNRISRVALAALATLIFIIRTNGIVEEGRWFTNRQDEIRSLISLVQEQEGNKFVVNDEQLKFDSNWSYPIESLILSSSDSDSKTVTVCTDTDLEYNQNSQHIKPEQFIFRRYEIYDVNVLNPSYFELDNSRYVHVSIPRTD